MDPTGGGTCFAASSKLGVNFKHTRQLDRIGINDTGQGGLQEIEVSLEPRLFMSKASEIRLITTDDGNAGSSWVNGASWEVES
jgi:hypothetical protein